MNFFIRNIVFIFWRNDLYNKTNLMVSLCELCGSLRSILTISARMTSATGTGSRLELLTKEADEYTVWR